MRVVAGEWTPEGGRAALRLTGEQLTRFGALAYQAALIDGVCEREARARRMRRRAAVLRKTNELKDQVDRHFDRVDERLRAECGMGPDRERAVWSARHPITGVRVGWR